MRDGLGLARTRAARRAARRANERPHDPHDQREARLVCTALCDAAEPSGREGRESQKPVAPREAAARAAIDACCTQPLSDLEWADVKRNLLGFFRQLGTWRQEEGNPP